MTLMINQQVSKPVRLLKGTIHLVRKQNPMKNLHFLPSDTYHEVRNISFSESFTYVLNKLWVT